VGAVGHRLNDVGMTGLALRVLLCAAEAVGDINGMRVLAMAGQAAQAIPGGHAGGVAMRAFRKLPGDIRVAGAAGIIARDGGGGHRFQIVRITAVAEEAIRAVAVGRVTFGAMHAGRHRFRQVGMAFQAGANLLFRLQFRRLHHFMGIIAVAGLARHSGFRLFLGVPMNAVREVGDFNGMAGAALRFFRYRFFRVREAVDAFVAELTT